MYCILAYFYPLNVLWGEKLFSKDISSLVCSSNTLANAGLLFGGFQSSSMEF
jgi:hypothetical protein